MKRDLTTFSPQHGMVGRNEFLDIISNAKFQIVKNNKKVQYYNIPCAFDIEVSSFLVDDRKCATMYVWQFGIMNWVTYGRTWEEYFEFMTELHTRLQVSENRILIIYVHNLAYEWQFVRKHVKWDKVFFLDERKPVYAQWSGFEFRCSLKLSSKSLAKVGDDLVKYTEHKHTGDLDYQLTRFSKTPLTDKELGYCEADIRVILAYIQEKIEKDGTICNIPLTNTGYVRKHCRKACFENYPRYRKLMHELTMDPEEYEQAKRAFAGGFTHASAKYVAKGKDKPLENVGSFDFTSSYPAKMVLEKRFPMSKAKVLVRLDNWDHLQHYLDNYCCMFDVTMTDVYAKLDYDHPLSASKLILPDDKEERSRILNGIREDNGRIVTADEMTMTFTELDWETFTEFYNFNHETIQIHQFRYYDRGYLPKELIFAILDLYEDKTVLKGIKGRELDYMISKNKLNASYGMMVTDIVRDILEYDLERSVYLDPRKPDLEEAIKVYNENKKRFSFYLWGIWITALARRSLFTGIRACGTDYVYSDTDSIKILNPEKHMDYIEAYNDLIMYKIKCAANHFRIPPERFYPKNKKGQEKIIGIWEYEGTYQKFKTLGAKRYLVQTGPGKYALTVAGVNKEKACDYLLKQSLKNNFFLISLYHHNQDLLLLLLPFLKITTPFDFFTHNLEVPEEYSGRLTLTYVDYPCSGTAVDYLGNVCEYEELSYIHMQPSDYNLTMSARFRGFIKYILGITEDSW